MPNEKTRIEALQRHLAEIEAFNHTVAHELRAPLQAITGHAREIDDKDGAHLSDDGRRRLQRVVETAVRMERLIDELLVLAWADHLKVGRQAVAVDTVVRDVLADLRRAWPGTRVVMSELPVIDADPAVVRQVFANVVGNAFKYSHRAAQPVVQIGIDTEGAFVVQDNGIGFSMEHAVKLFEPFARITVDAHYPGTGLGLSIVQRVLARHGGWITAQSREGGPTEFRFSFDGE